MFTDGMEAEPCSGLLWKLIPFHEVADTKAQIDDALAA